MTLGIKVSCRSRATKTEKCTKKSDARAKFFFCQSFLLFASPLQKLPIVEIHKFYYHGNVTPHFSSLML